MLLCSSYVSYLSFYFPLLCFPHPQWCVTSLLIVKLSEGWFIVNSTHSNKSIIFQKKYAVVFVFPEKLSPILVYFLPLRPIWLTIEERKSPSLQKAQFQRIKWDKLTWGRQVSQRCLVISSNVGKSWKFYGPQAATVLKVTGHIQQWLICVYTSSMTHITATKPGIMWIRLFSRHLLIDCEGEKYNNIID